MRGFFIPALLSLLLITGCAHNISEKSRALADKGITFAELQENPDAFRGKFVIFGGTIAAVEKTVEGARLEVIQYKLDSRELPDTTMGSSGRFLADVPESLGSAMCRRNRLVTVAGEVTGKETISLQGKDYVSPVISVKELHLFKFSEDESSGVWVPNIR